MLPLHSREAVEKIVYRIAGFQIIEQGLHGNAGPGKTRRAAHDIRVSRDDFPFHALIVGYLSLNSSQQKEPFRKDGRGGEI